MKSWLDNITKKDIDKFLLHFDWADGASEIKIKNTEIGPVMEIKFGSKKGGYKTLAFFEYGMVAKKGTNYELVYPFVDTEKANIRRGLLWCALLNKTNSGYKIDGKTYEEAFKENNRQAIREYYEGENPTKMNNDIRRLREFNFDKIDYRKR